VEHALRACLKAAWLARRRREVAFALPSGAVDNRHTERYFFGVKKIVWNPEKNEWLKENRRVCFEQVVNIEGYIYLVPRVETKDGVFLKTIIPSRKMTAKYLR
jgi:hypothetical protein